MDKIIIQKFKKADLKEIAQVMRLAFNSVNQGWTEKSSYSYIQAASRQSVALVAKTNNKIVGFIVADKKSDHLFIDAIGVLPSAMGQGVAKKLWGKMMNDCIQNNIKTLKMIADPTSLAFKWYKKLNFQETGWVELSLKLKK